MVSLRISSLQRNIQSLLKEKKFSPIFGPLEHPTLSTLETRIQQERELEHEIKSNYSNNTNPKWLNKLAKKNIARKQSRGVEI